MTYENNNFPMRKLVHVCHRVSKSSRPSSKDKEIKNHRSGAVDIIHRLTYYSVTSTFGIILLKEIFAGI